MVNIIGVDFSGAASDRNTWAAWAALNGHRLTIGECRPLSRGQLAAELENLPASAVAALDFPFSVPMPFASFWRPDAMTMPHLWEAAAGMSLRQFTELRDNYVAEHGEPKRKTDLAYPESFSCLHKVHPNMVPMTFYGMQMLARLWPLSFDVPPLPPRDTGRPVLLEVMPGAVLRSLGLPFKGYKNGTLRQEKRKTIVEQLPNRSPITLAAPKGIWELCLGNHDCLDAVVAALAAALWDRRQDLFHQPMPWGQALNDTIAIEGWLYAPSLISKRK